MSFADFLPSIQRINEFLLAKRCFRGIFVNNDVPDHREILYGFSRTWAVRCILHYSMILKADSEDLGHTAHMCRLFWVLPRVHHVARHI